MKRILTAIVIAITCAASVQAAHNETNANKNKNASCHRCHERREHTCGSCHREKRERTCNRCENRVWHFGKNRDRSASCDADRCKRHRCNNAE